MLGIFGETLGSLGTMGDNRRFYRMLGIFRDTLGSLGTIGDNRRCFRMLGIFWDTMGCFGIIEGLNGLKEIPTTSRGIFRDSSVVLEGFKSF